MSNLYDMHFAKHIADDQDFDTIFGAEEDDQLIGIVMKEGFDFEDDKVSTDSIENGTGLGAELGPKNDSKGAEAPKTDGSEKDSTIVKQKDSTQATNIVDATQGDDTQKPNDVDPESIMKGAEELKKTDEFKNDMDASAIKNESYVDPFDSACASLLEEALREEETFPSSPDVPSSTPQAPVDPVAVGGVEPSAPPQNPADAVSDDVADVVDTSATGADAPVPVGPNDIPVNDTAAPDVQTEGKLEDLAVGSDAEAKKVKDGNKVEDFLPDGEKREETTDGNNLSVGDHAEGSIEDGDKIDNVADAVPEGDDRNSADDSFKEAAASDLEEDEDILDELEDEVIEDAEDTDAASKSQIDDLNEDEDDDILDELLDI